MGSIDWILNYKSEIGCIIAIGDPESRKKIVKKITKDNVIFPTIIHPSVIKSNYVKIGKGTIIQAGVILTCDIIIKEFVHINIHSTVGHDCKIGDFVTLSPGVHISGKIIFS